MRQFMSLFTHSHDGANLASEGVVIGRGRGYQDRARRTPLGGVATLLASLVVRPAAPKSDKHAAFTRTATALNGGDSGMPNRETTRKPSAMEPIILPMTAASDPLRLGSIPRANNAYVSQ